MGRVISQDIGGLLSQDIGGLLSQDIGGLLSQDIGLLRAAGGRPRFWLKFIFLLAVLAPIYATLTSIVYWTPSFGINPSADGVRTLPILIIVVLTSLLLAITWSEMDERRKKTNNARGPPATGEKSASSPVGWLGSLVGFFATGCAICQPIWLVWLGLGQASLFLIDLSVWISGLSLLLLLFALHKKLNESCAVKK